jgi:hypothetical protein
VELYFQSRIRLHNMATKHANNSPFTKYIHGNSILWEFRLTSGDQRELAKIRKEISVRYLVIGARYIGKLKLKLSLCLTKYHAMKR